MKGTGRTDRGAIDVSQTRERKSREVDWMLKLRTVYPYGLNDRIGDEYKDGNQGIQVGNRFFPLEHDHVRVRRGINRRGKNTFTSVTVLLEEIGKQIQSNRPNAMNFIRVSLASVRKSLLKGIYSSINDRLNHPSFVRYYQWYRTCLDIIECKLYSPPKVKVHKKAPANMCKIFFCNKGVELVNLPRILHDSSLSDHLPSLPLKFETPTITYKLTETLGKKIFNFNNFVKGLDVQECLDNEEYLPCNCQHSNFIDNHHKHIITGNLGIIKNPKLRKLFAKGPKYREPVPINWGDVVTNISVGLDECILKWCNKNALRDDLFKPWKDKVIDLVQDRISVLQNRIGTDNVSEVLKEPEVILALKELHKNYVICPIDKATGNVAIICKRFYAYILFKELNIPTIIRDMTTTGTYCSESTLSAEEIVKKHRDDLMSKFGLSVKEDNECLPHMYWLPKKHKDPSGSRFIVAAPKCSVKPLSKYVTSVFKMFYKQIEHYNDKILFFSGVKSFWCIQNNAPVKKSIHKINSRSKARSVMTFDFSTLYTKIPHNKLLYVLNQLIDFCFKGGDKSYIVVSEWGAKWVNNVNDHNIWFDIKRIKSAVKYLLDNCFFKVGNFLFRQCIGIPMGSDPAPFFANLFLYFYESKWINKIKKESLYRARRFTNTFRFIDDLDAMNDCGEFEKCFKDIYPQELELKKENNGNKQATFLDLDISVNDNKFEIKLFDKRDAFPFSIVRMPFYSSNIPSSIFYASIGAETLRICRATTNIDHFTSSVKIFIARMMKQGAIESKVDRTLKKSFGRHNSLFVNIASTATDFVKLLLY